MLEPCRLWCGEARRMALTRTPACCRSSAAGIRAAGAACRDAAAALRRRLSAVGLQSANSRLNNRLQPLWSVRRAWELIQISEALPPTAHADHSPPAAVQQQQVER